MNLDTVCTMCDINAFPGLGRIMGLVGLKWFTVRAKGMLLSTDDTVGHLKIWIEEDLQTCDYSRPTIKKSVIFSRYKQAGLTKWLYSKC